MPRNVRLAVLLAFVLHGFLILTGQYHLSFDAYTHMFFADHYRLNWWSLWDPRWYTGFTVTSYPPLVHQLIALPGYVIGVDAAFAAVLWITLTVYPLGVYAFSRAFTGRATAGYAALGAAVLPSIYLSAHNFGQLPTLFATLVALFGVASLAEFLRRGDTLSGALTVALFAVTAAAHHATLLFLPWVIAALLLHLLLNQKIDKVKLFLRLSVFLVAALAAGLLVIWPFWAWGRAQSLQVPIDHLSRHNFLSDPSALLVFFLPMYGPLILLIPFALWKGMQRRYIGLSIAFLGLFILGLGGTTPAPRWLFGNAWEWLTYDRFAFWASLTLLPFFGAVVLFGRQRLAKHPRPRRSATLAIFACFAVISMTIGVFPTIRPSQPGKINMQPIVNFLARKNYAKWRYITFGFGDQLAYLSRLTPATTIDGSYHTARTLPELRKSGIAQIDSVFWTDKGLKALDPILKKSGERGVRWAFVNLPDYIPVLQRNGWDKFTTLSNGIEIWENPSVVLPQTDKPTTDDPLASFSWGFFPLLALAVSAGLAGVRLHPFAGQKVLLRFHQAAIGLLPLTLGFWYYFSLVTSQRYPDVYFTYTDTLFFLSDGLAVVAVLAWLIATFFGPPKISAGPKPATKFFSATYLQRWLFALCLLASLSILWSTDRHVSLYVSLHLWLVFGLFLSIQDQPGVAWAVALGFYAALIPQIYIGFSEFFTQSTSLMQPFNLQWPGMIDATTPGASVVQLQDGARWLRAYGTFPHPNILAGFLLAFLAGPIMLFLMFAKRRRLTILLFGLCGALLILTFSRAAWLGLAAVGVILVFHRLKLNGKRLKTLMLSGLAGLVLAAAPLYTLILTRAGAGNVPTEIFSDEARLWLIKQTLKIIKDHPLLGVGVGSNVLEYSRHAPYGYLIEPVHNLPLLVTSELGIAGALILVGLAISIALGSLRARRPQTIIFSAVLVGLCVTALFDHYLWTLAPGRMLLGLVLGVWAAQVKQDENEDVPKQT